MGRETERLGYQGAFKGRASGSCPPHPPPVMCCVSWAQAYTWCLHSARHLLGLITMNEWSLRFWAHGPLNMQSAGKTSQLVELVKETMKLHKWESDVGSRCRKGGSRRKTSAVLKEE